MLRPKIIRMIPTTNPPPPTRKAPPMCQRAEKGMSHVELKRHCGTRGAVANGHAPKTMTVVYDVTGKPTWTPSIS